MFSFIETDMAHWFAVTKRSGGITNTYVCRPHVFSCIYSVCRLPKEAGKYENIRQLFLLDVKFIVLWSASLSFYYSQLLGSIHICDKLFMKIKWKSSMLVLFSRSHSIWDPSSIELIVNTPLLRYDINFTFITYFIFNFGRISL